ncbi:LPXTG-motif cell wall anchor domain-containing protein/fibro-slime domain-containing protein [Pseudobutyrivibrio sp. OR37]|uniref:SpaA isopeptide-forming pilin-related protein n=1 Tax=Pseudobutyrivibrio sp. OR37 TaxID=1798186 RepID=UPI0008ED5FBE|nr:SpaA isopeptide-forming pilin-related protein [Pseudobutyrivibrio sp. OR37]SFH97981.1 LPXTG-motif cell wall anchor domain-containing protein/fibro-slime domain-containing protein [Pseudobutyrivibrio sp. OR37]
MKNNLVLKRTISFGLAMALLVSAAVSVYADEKVDKPVETTFVDTTKANEAGAGRETTSETELATEEKGESEPSAGATEATAEKDSEEEPTGDVVEEVEATNPADVDTEENELEENTETEIEICDDANLVRIIAKQDVLNGAVKVIVNEITQESDEGEYNQMADVLNNESGADVSVVDFVAYDISLLNENDQEVEPTGEVKVEFNNPSVEGLDDNSLTTEVYHYENASVNKMNSVTPGSDSVEMITNHFSTYIIAIKERNKKDISHSNYITVEEKDTGIHHRWHYRDDLPTDIASNGYQQFFRGIQFRVYLNDDLVEVSKYIFNQSIEEEKNVKLMVSASPEYAVDKMIKQELPQYTKNIYNGQNFVSDYSDVNIAMPDYLTSKNIIYFDIFLRDNSRGTEVVPIGGARFVKYGHYSDYSMATIYDKYKEEGKEPSKERGKDKTPGFTFNTGGTGHIFAGDDVQGQSFYRGIYTGLASDTIDCSLNHLYDFRLNENVFSSQEELFPDDISKCTNPGSNNEEPRNGAVYNANLEFVKNGDYYELDSNKYSYELLDENGNKAEVGKTYATGTLKKKDYVSGQQFIPYDNSFHFGMIVPIYFNINSDGQTGDKDTIFEFAGDDDLFVYIDGKLALDLGGIHNKIYGSINFQNGNVLVDSENVKYEKNIYSDTTRELFANSSKPHLMTIVYFERGNTASNCRIRFNFVPKTVTREFKKSLTIQKEWDDVNNTQLRPSQLKFNVCGSYSEEGIVKYVDLAGNGHDDKASAMTEVLVSANDNWQKTINDLPVFFKNDTRKKITWNVEEVVPEEYEQIVSEKWYTETTDIKKEDLIPEPASEGGIRYSHFDIETNAVSDDNSVGQRTIESIRDLKGNENCVSVLGYYENQVWVPSIKSVVMFKHNDYEWRADNQAIGENTVLLFYVKYSGRDDYKLVIIDKNSYYPEGAKYYKHNTEFRDNHEPFKNLAMYYTGTDNPRMGYVDLSGKNLFTTGVVECPVTVATGLGQLKNDHFGYNESGIDLVLSPKTIESVSVEATGDEHYKFKNKAIPKVNLTFKKIVDGKNNNPDALYSIKVEKVSDENKKQAELVDYRDGKVYIGNTEILNAELTSEYNGVAYGVGCGNGIYNIWADQTVTITGLPIGTYRITEVGAFYGVELEQFKVSIKADGKTFKSNTADIECGNGDKYVEIHNKVKQTFGWKLKKVSATLKTKTLSGAKFSLRSKDKTFYGISGEDGYVGWYTSESFSQDTLVTEIEDGKYILKELEAPVGYAVNDEEWIVEIDKYKSVTVSKGKTQIAKTDKNNPTIEVAFENKVAYTLPATGGRGTYLYTIGGVLLMIVGALLLYKNKKK